MNRLALENGTRLWHNNASGSITEITGTSRNDSFSDMKYETLAVPKDNTFATRLLFPSAIDITHEFIANRVNQPAYSSFGVIYKSNDTTDGFDGTWVSAGRSLVGHNSYDDGSPQAFAHTGVKGLRWQSNCWNTSNAIYYQMFALYGTWSNSQLQMIETGTTNPVHGEDINFGTVQRGITDDTSYAFRVRNTGALQANGVTVSSYMYTQDTLGGSVVGIAFSDDGGTTWHNNLDLGNIASGNNSGIINIKLTTFNDMPVGRYRPRIVLDAASWS